MSQLSQSQLSEEGDESIEEEPLEEVSLKYMRSTGFMAKIKGEIARYVLDIAKDRMGETTIFPERANEKLLKEIYYYLKWVGMTNTAGVLLSESPISPLNLKSDTGDVGKKFPNLYTLFISEGHKVETLPEKKDQESLGKHQPAEDKTPQTTKLVETSVKTDLEVTGIEEVPTPTSLTELIIKKPLLQVQPDLLSTTYSIADPEAATIDQDLDINLETPTTTSATTNIINKHLLFPKVAKTFDLLTGSPMSTPQTSLSRIPFLGNIAETEKSGGQETCSLATGKLSFEDLLKAYVDGSTESSKKKTPILSSKSEDLDLSKTITPAADSNTTQKNFEARLQKFQDEVEDFATLTSTPISDGNATPSSPPPADTTFTIVKDSSPRRRPLEDEIKLPTTLQEEEDEEKSESVSPPSKSKSKSHQKEKGAEAEKSHAGDPTTAPNKDKSEDGSISDILSLDLEYEQDNDNTQDVSLSSEAIGMSQCEHVISADPTVDEVVSKDIAS